MFDTTTTVTRTALAKKADKVGVIFDLIGWVILAAGGLVTLIAVLVGLFGDDTLMVGLLTAIAVGVYTAVMWASVSLATIVAQYIASKS